MSVPSPSVGQIFGHYRIVEKIGSGGMGMVYRAYDERLHRDVALKLIQPGTLASDSARDRFRAEALAVGRLNHPNIAVAFDFSAERGLDYFVTEYVPGVTLAQKIKSGPLSTKSATDLGIQLARGLDAAHRQGIVHRDLKPGNLKVTPEGVLKILDFGLAGLVHDEGADVHSSFPTASDVVSGTMPYMSPEQLRGEAADPRMDIWAAGAVLYEMLTGHPPFTEKQPTRLIESILHDEPRPPSNLNPRVSTELQSVVLKALDKNPERRYQSVRELCVDLVRTLPDAESTRSVPRPAEQAGSRRARKLGWLAAALVIAIVVAGALGIRFGRAPAPQQKLLVVLPFEAVGHDAQAVALGLGLTETLTAKLGEMSEPASLQLISTRDIQAQGIRSAEDARRQFGTDLVLEGSLQQSGELIRVNTSLVDAKTRRQLGARTITAAQNDIFGLEDKVVSEVAGILASEVGPRERSAPAATRSVPPVAYQHYLRGRGYLEEYQKSENIDNAIAELNQAVAVQRDYPEAYAGLGEAYLLGYQQYGRGNDWVTRAADYCESAIRSGPQLPESHACLASIALARGQYRDAVDHFNKARQLGSTSERTLDGLAEAYDKTGNADAAERIYKQSVATQPRYWAVYSHLGNFYFGRGRYAEAEQAFRRATEVAPDNYRGYSNLGGVYVTEARYLPAIDTLKRSIALRPNRDAYSNLSSAYFGLGRFEEAADACREALKFDDSDWLTWGNLGDALYRSGNRRRPEARAAYAKALALGKSKLDVNAHDATLLAFLADYAAMVHDFPAARDYLERALSLDPSNADVQFRAAICYNQFGEEGKTLSALEKAVAGGTPVSAIQATPDFKSLRSNPRYRALIGEAQ